MTDDKDLEIFALLQPELLTADQLISYLKSRCSSIQNPNRLSRERLLRLFRQVILPLPQRQCWPNRRGKVRRLKSGPEGRQEESSSRPVNAMGTKRLPSGGDRLKPAPDTHTPNKIRITSSDATSRTSDLERIVINDRRRPSEAESSSAMRNYVKRSSSDKNEKCSTESSSLGPLKKQRTAIKWP